MSLKLNLVGFAAVGALLAVSAGGAYAQTKPTIQQLENQIQDIQQSYQSQLQSLQQQVDQLKEQQRQNAAQAEVVRQQAAQTQAEVKQASSGLGGTYHVGGVTLKVGGFVEAAGIYRSSNETADVGSIFGSNKSSGIPFGAPYFSTSPTATNLGVNNHDIDEWRESSRQSRLSLLASGQPDANTNLIAYWENDFLGQGGTANSNESNSYNLRMRQAFMEYDRSDLGLNLLAGQTWSLATLDGHGLDPFKVVTPLSIDAQYNVGFNWMRQPQIRLTDQFAPGFWAAVSAENPQLNNPYGAPSWVATKETGGGGGLLSDSNTSFSFDGMPDIVVKLAAEPGWGHYEIYGLARQFRDQVVSDITAATPIVPPGTATLGNKSAFGGGVGFGAVLPVVPHLLDVTVSGLWGEGIGKYASGQLPDVTFNPATGAIAPIQEIEAMVGVIGHPTPTIDLYSYLGIERESSKTFDNTSKSDGYGSPYYNNTNCAFGNNSGNVSTTSLVGLDTNGTCDVNQLWQLQVGGWWNFYKGEYGRMAFGASYSYVGVDTFSGVGGAPRTHDNIVMTSFRYYPF
jgi:hypothetical protein